MVREEGACLVCGKPIIYYEKAESMECVMCHREFESHASCTDKHYVCDECHAKKGIRIIMEGLRNNPSRNPIVMMQDLMANPYIYMHGPEHHVLVGAVLLAAYKNCGGYQGKGGQLEFEKALEEMKERGSEYPGGACGIWGCCGAAVSAGIFMSIITKATPLSGKSWRLSNLMTSRALAAIAELGGPRCCKRDSFTAVKEAVVFMKENFAIEMELPEKINCDYSKENAQCLKKYCPYYRKGQDNLKKGQG